MILREGKLITCGTLSEDNTADPLPTAVNCFSISDDEIPGAWESSGISQRQLLELGWHSAGCPCGEWRASRSEDRVNTTILAQGLGERCKMTFFCPSPKHSPNGLSKLLQPWLSVPVLAVSPLLYQTSGPPNTRHPGVQKSPIHWLMVCLGPTSRSVPSPHLQAWEGAVYLRPHLQPWKPRLEVMLGGYTVWGRLLHPGFCPEPAGAQPRCGVPEETQQHLSLEATQSWYGATWIKSPQSN